jgi:hypothetical protein
LTLGINLFETPVSAVLVVGAFLLCARQLTAPARLLLGWALAPVIANFLYWHHGLFMGPRMLHEAAPAWSMLTAVAGVGLVERIPQRAHVARFHIRSAATVGLLGALVFGLLVLAPQRGLSYGGEWLAITRVPAPQVKGPALIFVHDAWKARVGMTLASHGYRLDTVETLLRQNSTCAVHEFAGAVGAGDSVRVKSMLARLDTVPRASRLPRAVEIAPGDPIRIQPNEVPTAECRVQMRSDERGILDLAPLLWRGDLPGAAARGALYVRDLGPTRNAELIARHPDRQPYVYAQRGDAIVLYPYAEGMSALWP